MKKFTFVRKTGTVPGAFMARRWGLSLFFISFLVASAFAQAQQSAAPIPRGMSKMEATVWKIEGEVVVTKAGATAAKPLRIGDLLGSGDMIETKADGKIAIKMDNGNSVNLTSNSQIILSSLASDLATNEYENIMESKYGTIRACIVAKLKGRSTFKIKTPTAISGARGTVFYLVITATSTRVYVTSGSVDFSNLATGNTFVVVENMTAISDATGVSEPVELTDADKEAVLAAYSACLGGECEQEKEKIPDAPSQTDSPEKPTDNPPPGQQEPEPEPPSPSEPPGK